MLAAVIFIRPVCTAWQLHLAGMVGGFLEPKTVVIMVICFSNLLSLLHCVLPDPNRLRAFVAASFVLSILHVAEIPVLYFTAAIIYSLFGPFDSLDAIPQIPQRYYLMLFLFNLIVMCGCFLTARWLRKIQEKPPLGISVLFCLFFISFAIITSVFIITIWLWNMQVLMPLSFLALALLGILLVCIPLFAVYFFFTAYRSQGKNCKYSGYGSRRIRSIYRTVKQAGTGSYRSGFGRLCQPKKTCRIAQYFRKYG